ncbi:MAG TPA: L-lactate permease [Gemmataceae bacterium]|nr:L-lactate permease [Gemmataceae bacterium]
MLWAYYQQNLDPLSNRLLSTAFAALPVIVLFWLLVPRRWPAPRAALGGAIAALLVAWFVYRMPPLMAIMAFVHGAGFGLLPVGWTIFNAMLLYNVTVESGHFRTVRRSVAGLSADARIQAILIAFAFGAFLEGAAGGGTPVAICGAIMVGLGFDPFLSAVLCLIANTSPVAYGGLGTPLITLTGVTNLPTETLSIMAGHQLPLLSFAVPIYMIKCMCTWKQTLEVWPALLVAGGSFSVFQFTFATLHHYVPGLVLYPMTDIGGGIFSLIITAIFLKFWKPHTEWHFSSRQADKKKGGEKNGTDFNRLVPLSSLGSGPASSSSDSQEPPLTAWKIGVAWAPYALMSLLLLWTGLVRQKEQHGPVHIGPLRTKYAFEIYALHDQSHRDPRLVPVRTEQVAALAIGSTDPLGAIVNAYSARQWAPRAEKAEFDFAWLTAPGSAVFAAALLSMLLLRMSPAQVGRVFHRTFFQMRIPIPTIACMLGLSYVTRYAGLDATLGVAFAETGPLYPFFAAILGWLGVFLTGTDAGSNALFGSLQKITATEVFKGGAFHYLGLAQSQILICTANSTGGVMGKMIDAQSICVATAATHQLGKEADIFKAVFWHSILLAIVVGGLTMLQAYVPPFTLLVPTLKG